MVFVGRGASSKPPVTWCLDCPQSHGPKHLIWTIDLQGTASQCPGVAWGSGLYEKGVVNSRESAASQGLEPQRAAPPKSVLCPCQQRGANQLSITGTRYPGKSPEKGRRSLWFTVAEGSIHSVSHRTDLQQIQGSCGACPPHGCREADR